MYDLLTKINYEKDEFVINPFVFEYVAHNKQKQVLFTLLISKDRYVLIYGMVGSVNDNLISTLIYSLITTYSVDEVNIYALDFGAETLRLYKNAPQIGGLVFSSEKDRIANLFKLIKKIIEERKKLFIEYSGSYESYLKNSGQTLPNVILILNNFETFNDTYGVNHFEDLVSITREGTKYGVYVIVTVSGTNGMRSKLSQNFAFQFTLQMNDDYDYRSIVGRTEIKPAKFSGRGLVKLDDIYEFQTAYPDKPEKISDRVKYICNELIKQFVRSDLRFQELPKTV